MLYRALYGMAMAELRSKADTSAWFFLNAASGDFEDIAWATASKPYSRRLDDDFLEITGLILGFFPDGKSREKKDLFFFLKGVSGMNLREKVSEISQTGNRLLSYVHTAVTRHIAADPRYSRNCGLVTDLDALEKTADRQASVDEILAGCAPMLRGNEKPGRLVGLVFDWLLERHEYSGRLQVSVLKSAVFELIKTRFIPPERESTMMDPMQEYLQKEMLRLAGEALEETTATYGWRAGGSARYRIAYERAGRDMLEEIIVHGRKPAHHEALGRHIGGCDVDTYRKRWMGSFQNFWKALWENFLKKIRADI